LTGRVIDSSTIAKFLLKEEGWGKAGEVLMGKPYTLDLAVKEVANTIWRRVTSESLPFQGGDEEKSLLWSYILVYSEECLGGRISRVDEA